MGPEPSALAPTFVVPSVIKNDRWAFNRHAVALASGDCESIIVTTRIACGEVSVSIWQCTVSRTESRKTASVSASVKFDAPNARAATPPSGASATRKMISCICPAVKFDRSRNLRRSDGYVESLSPLLPGTFARV